MYRRSSSRVRHSWVNRARLVEEEEVEEEEVRRAASQDIRAPADAPERQRGASCPKCPGSELQSLGDPALAVALALKARATA